MKNKFFIFSSILIFVGILFCISSCQDINNPKQINLYINLDLSNLQDIQSSQEYILKVLAYNAYSYENGSEIENLPLIAETESKFDQNGNVNVSFEVEIGCKIILVAKLYQIIDGKESITPLYVGNSDVIKIKASENKVHIILKKQQNDINNTTVNDNHQHTYSDEWCMSITHHWKWASCGHDVIGEISAHNFSDWTVRKAATEEAVGRKEHVCTVCNYKEVVDIAKIPEDFVLIPAGTFQMGSESEVYSANKPVHQVTITKSFYMGKYEVTQAEYEKYCSYGGSSPSSSYGYGDNYPAYYVSWYDALVYCNKRSIAEGLSPCYRINEETDPTKWGTVPKSSNSTWNAVVCDWGANGYRLPTEAEWEYAARAGDNTVDRLTCSGTSDVNKLDEYAWYEDNSSLKTHEVGTKKANGFGLYDMSGNVFEWCWNWKTSSYDTGKEGGSDPTGASAGSSRVARGGSWLSDFDLCAVSWRNDNQPNERSIFLGFRVVRSAN